MEDMLCEFLYRKGETIVIILINKYAGVVYMTGVGYSSTVYTPLSKSTRGGVPHNRPLTAKMYY